jgi:hypothetical protein
MISFQFESKGMRKDANDSVLKTNVTVRKLEEIFYSGNDQSFSSIQTLH